MATEKEKEQSEQQAAHGIKGYRELSGREIEEINRIKELGELLGKHVELMKKNPAYEQRWVSIGATDLQTGLMALTRAIARPTFF